MAWHAVRAAVTAALGLWLGIAAGLAQEAPVPGPEAEPRAAPRPIESEPVADLTPEEEPSPAEPEAAPPRESEDAAEEAPPAGEESAPEHEGAGAEVDERPSPGIRPEAPRPRATGPPPAPRRSAGFAAAQRLERRRNEIVKRGAEIERELADAKAKLADARARVMQLASTKRKQSAAIRTGDRTRVEAAQFQATAQNAAKDYLELYAEAGEGSRRAAELTGQCEEDLRQYGRALATAPFSDVRQELQEQLANARELSATWDQVSSVAARGASEAAGLSSAIVAAVAYAREHSPWQRSANWISAKTAEHAAEDIGLAFARIARAVTSDLPEWLRGFGARLSTAAGSASFFLRLLASALLTFAGIYGFGRLRGYAERRASAPDRGQTQELSAAVEATLGVVRALIIFVVGSIIIWLCGFSGPWLRFLLVLVALVAGPLFLENVTERVLSPAERDRRLVPATDEHATHLYRTFRSFLVYSAILLPIIIGLAMFPYEHHDVLAALWFVYGLGTWIYMFALLVPLGGPRALIPESDTVGSRMVRRAAAAIPSAALSLGAVVLGVHAAGYTNLSQLLVRAIPAAVVVATLVWVLHRTYVFQVERRLAAISVADAESADWRIFARAGRPLFGLVERLGVMLLGGALIIWAGRLPTGYLRELSGLLSKPLFTVQDTEVSAWALVSAALVVVFSVLIARIIRDMLHEAGPLRRQYDAGVRYAISSMVYYVLVIVAVLWAVRIAGFSLGILAVFAGVAGIGLAFGLQDILKNFISGLILLLEQPIKVGDFIDMGGGGADSVRGIVTQISIRSTTVRTLDNIFVIVPNADFVTQRVLNMSHRDLKVRLQINVGVSYDSDVKSVREILRKVGEDHPLTLNDPSPDVRLMGFGDSSVDFRLLTWIADPLRTGPTTSELNFAVWHALQEHGIEIPFPQRDLHIRSDATLSERRDEAAPPSKDA